MNTLVVLSALAAIATAAPTLPENHYSGHRPLSYQFTPTFRREKKSPVDHNDAVPVLEVSQKFPSSELSHAHEVSARSSGSKKPIIVKNKLGYHLYRDSDEEQAQADSQEKCTKEVKVKLCDVENLQAKSSNLRDNFVVGEANIHQSENEMEHSIKMAKETVENLQKMSHWKHSEFGPDAEIHKDIEVARQALAHIQQNFGNLESMNMRTSILNDAEALHDAHLQITKGERMAQWKEAMDNIQKNTEVARNLEDNFSSTNEHAHLSHIEQTQLTTHEKSSDTKKDDSHKLLTKKISLKDEKLSIEPKEAKMEHEQFHKEMKAAASEIKEAKFMTEHELKAVPSNDKPLKPFEALSQDTLFRSHNDLSEQNIHTETHEKAKISDFDSPLRRPVAPVVGKETEAKEPSVKSAELIKMDVEANKLKQSDNADKVLSSVNSKHSSTIKSAEVNHDTKEDNVHEFDKEVDSKTHENNLKNSKSISIESDAKNINAKASEHVSAVDQKKAVLQTDSLNQEKTSNFDSSTFAKAEEHQRMDDLHKKSSENAEKFTEMTMTSVDSDPAITRKLHLENTAEKSVDQAAHMSEQVSSRVLAPVAHHLSETDLSAKMVEHLDAEHQHQLHNFHSKSKIWEGGQVSSMKNAAIDQNIANFDSHLQAKTWQAQNIASMKNSAVEQRIADSHNQEMQQEITDFSPMSHRFSAKHPHFSGQAHHYQVHHPSQFGHLKNPHHGLPYRAAESLNAQEKAAEMDNAVLSTLQVNTNEPSGKTALEHDANWKQQQVGAARGAYGAYGLGGAGIGASIGAGPGLAGGSSGGSGAIGVFPHANTGGCAIPLLLSCSPSVVSGSLAKAHSGYGAPAYRAGENVNFHSKRDTKKSNEITAAKAQRTPTKVIQKIPYSLNKKN